MKLYQLTDRYHAIENMLDMDIEGITQDSVNQTLVSIKDEIDNKVISIGKMVLELKSDVEAIKIEEERLAKRRTSANNRIEWLKSYLLIEMQSCNVLKVKAPEISVSVQNSPPSIELMDLSLVPRDFIRVIPEKRELDKIAVKEHFVKTDEIVSGTNIILDKKFVSIR